MMQTGPAAPPASDFELPDPDQLARVQAHFEQDESLFAGLVGIRIGELRRGWSQIMLPFRSQLMNAGGLVHGGVIATVVDMAAVPAVALARGEDGAGATVDLHVQYLGSTKDEDLIGTGWVVRMTGSLAFARAEVTTPSGKLLAVGQHTFRLLKPR